MPLRRINKELEQADAQVIGLVRHDRRIPAPSLHREVRENDILVIEADPDGIAAALSALDLRLVEEVDRPQTDQTDASQDAITSPADRGKAIQSEDVILAEMAVLPNSTFIGRSATDIRLRTRYAVNLLAVSRQGQRSMARLRTMQIKAGDVLLMQGSPEGLAEFARQLGCVPLAERPLYIPDTRQAIKATTIMAAAIIGAATGLASAPVCFALGVLVAMVTRVISPRSVYDAVDWPVIVLLAALIPVAGAMETTGAANLIARLLLEKVAGGHPAIAIGLILIVTMTLSDFMNNAATAAVMCPIAIGSAAQLGASSDPFLMAVAVGASCAFLTPIGHQNNTLILGPGGFRFGDYWRLGLPVEVIVVAVGLPMLLWIWPL
jgi:di/tricarboxylate transporter